MNPETPPPGVMAAIDQRMAELDEQLTHVVDETRSVLAQEGWSRAVFFATGHMKLSGLLEDPPRAGDLLAAVAIVRLAQSTQEPGAVA